MNYTQAAEVQVEILDKNNEYVTATVLVEVFIQEDKGDFYQPPYFEIVDFGIIGTILISAFDREYSVHREEFFENFKSDNGKILEDVLYDAVCDVDFN